MSLVILKPHRPKTAPLYRILSYPETLMTW